MLTARRFLRSSVAGILSLACASLALATSNYQYKTNEYALVKGGLSPDGLWSITAHGEGELGDDNFHVYLMDAKAGKKIGPLTEITDGSWQDTAPKAYHAKWSPDSKMVTISYRSDRHTVSLIKYKIDKRRAFKLVGPKATTDREAAELGWPDLEN